MSECYYDEAGCLVCPEQAAVPAQAPYVDQQPVLGWTAGAHSVDQLDGDLHTVFDVPLGAQGVVIGLKGGRMRPADPSLIEHGFYFQSMEGVNRVSIMERGVEVSARRPHAAADLFEIHRADGVVRYLVNGERMAISVAPSAGPKVVATSLYASGDQAPSAASGCFWTDTTGCDDAGCSDTPPPVTATWNLLTCHFSDVPDDTGDVATLSADLPDGTAYGPGATDMTVWLPCVAIPRTPGVLCGEGGYRVITVVVTFEPPSGDLGWGVNAARAVSAQLQDDDGNALFDLPRYADTRLSDVGDTPFILTGQVYFAADASALDAEDAWLQVTFTLTGATGSTDLVAQSVQATCAIVTLG